MEILTVKQQTSNTAFDFSGSNAVGIATTTGWTGSSNDQELPPLDQLLLLQQPLLLDLPVLPEEKFASF